MVRRLATVAALVFAATATAQTDYARDVLPILADKCYHCHGPDEASRQAGIRLDTKDGAFRKRKGKSLLVPGKSDESEVIRRVVSRDPDVMMPPPDSNRSLTPKQIETLKRWVDEGAKWGTHWAYRPVPATVPVPAGSTNPIDAFIRQRLAIEKVTPNPEASRATWLRRVTFDLTGLPPTVAELDRFEADKSPTAYETVVDRLLASPRYGERMAADWLDLARFADTHGYQSDRARPMWAYRDWVIRAFNRNLPFDQFAVEQLAGDLLPNATKDQRLATAFNRLHMQNEEGGVVEEEFRVAYVVDRVNTFGTAFLAQTFECCRCHDHKYDPLAQADYYKLFAFFQNIDESGQTSYFTPAMPVPTLLLTTDEQDKKLAALTATVKEKERAVAMSAATTRTTPAVPVKPVGLVAAFDFDEFAGNKSPNRIDAKSPATGHDGPTLVPGHRGKAVRLNGENGFEFPGVGHFGRSDPFSFSIWLNPSAHAPRAVVLHHSRAPIDAGSRGYELLLENGRVAFGMHHMWPGDSVKVAATRPIPVNAWSHVVVTSDGSGTAAGLKVYLDGKPVTTDVVRDRLKKDIIYEGGEPNLALGFRFRDNGFKNGTVDELLVFDRELIAAEAAVLFDPKAVVSDRDQLAYRLATQDAEYKKAVAELRAARKELATFVHRLPDTMVMDEMPAAKPAFVLKRGAYDAPGDKVTADTPGTLPPFPADLPRNRLGLARWLTNRDHPLFARVTVNRLWQQMFGAGLVETSDNFGTTGTPPTHPELLDWLARDFSRDWDVKRLLKQMALSGTYRQTSTTTAEQRTRDPYNQLLGRAPARRLTAEMLRDQALFAGGKLVETLGGPSVYPYQPDGLWNEAMGRPHYPRSSGPDLYRRGLYTHWKRTAPPPQMVTFDAADRSVCTARRQTTSTPLQALVLLNDPTFVEAARFLGERALTQTGSTSDRVRWLFRTATSRPATDKEAAILERIFVEQRAQYAADPKAADKLLAVGDSKPDPKLDKLDLAAATVVAQALLNHDETVNRR